MLALVSTMTLAAGSHTVYAQQAAAPEVDEIVISGFRQAILKIVFIIIFFINKRLIFHFFY